ncbi:hypothetical protein PV08_03246 [Exophiala spinifera]|uniref:DUF7492 domain-containing protein n=1 Tax=Exophiala spinifera TaxID=91928 RepID=A0A0D2A1Z7_9EURO|nr:uncharacterized protein PV08_03246 [Exophiala spinifera]KIW18957.1 hypothetical protein PV08_03246 [Exophiala spinifera]
MSLSKPSLRSILFGMLAAAPVASAHSWIEQMLIIAPNGTLAGVPGFARGNVLRQNNVSPDEAMVNLIPPNGRQNSVLPTDLMCRASQTSQTQTDGSPRLQAVPGSAVALRYQENGHVTMPGTQPGKPDNRGTIYVYGTTDPSPDDALLAIHRVWTPDGKGGDGRGVLLSTQNFDDGQCYQINGSPLSAQRQVTYAHAAEQLMGRDLWCQTDIQIPLDAPTGKPYTLYWVWDWPTLPGGDPSLPNGKQEIYTTCMDVDIVADIGIDPYSKGQASYVPGQSYDMAAVSAQFAELTNPTAVTGSTIAFGATATGPVPGGASEASVSAATVISTGIPDFLTVHTGSTAGPGLETQTFSVVPMAATDVPGAAPTPPGNSGPGRGSGGGRGGNGNGNAQFQVATETEWESVTETVLQTVYLTKYTKRDQGESYASPTAQSAPTPYLGRGHGEMPFAPQLFNTTGHELGSGVPPFQPFNGDGPVTGRAGVGGQQPSFAPGESHSVFRWDHPCRNFNHTNNPGQFNQTTCNGTSGYQNHHNGSHSGLPMRPNLSLSASTTSPIPSPTIGPLLTLPDGVVLTMPTPGGSIMTMPGGSIMTMPIPGRVDSTSPSTFGPAATAVVSDSTDSDSDSDRATTTKVIVATVTTIVTAISLTTIDASPLNDPGTATGSTSTSTSASTSSTEIDTGVVSVVPFPPMASSMSTTMSSSSNTLSSSTFGPDALTVFPVSEPTVAPTSTAHAAFKLRARNPFVWIWGSSIDAAGPTPTSSS